MQAEFHKLRALGGLLISARKARANATAFVRVEALHPGPVELAGRAPAATHAHAGDVAPEPPAAKCVTVMAAGWGSGGQSLPLAMPASVAVRRSAVHADGVTFELQPGAHVVLYPPPAPPAPPSPLAPPAAASPPPTFEIMALPDNSTEFHWFGYRQQVTDMEMQCSGDWPSFSDP